MSKVPQLLEELKMSAALACYQKFSQSMTDREQLLLRV